MIIVCSCVNIPSPIIKKNLKDDPVMQNEGWKGKLTLPYSESQLNCCIQQCTFFTEILLHKAFSEMQFKIFPYI